MTGDKDWYRQAFNTEYLDLYAHRSDAAATEEVAWLSEVVIGGKPRTLLDLGCGAGRHTRALARSGHEVLGIDLSRDLLQRAQEAGGPSHYCRGDMRQLPLANAHFDFVLSLFTSFGYFPTDDENAIVIREVVRVLKRDGEFVLDFLNAPMVRATLVSSTTSSHGDQTMVQQRRISSDGRRVIKRVSLTGPDQDRQWTESVRLFGRDELISMLHAADFTVTEVFGSLDGQRWTSKSPRCVLRAKKR
ncbi:MAG: class I SAM-dependent methyltransferase [Planctomycetes bacterium]|nr:class I SAM-dependent methyltransferase [Planctomycetota bacterium]